MRHRPWHWLAPLLLAIGLYAVTVPGTFIYDDVEIARDDARLRDPHAWGHYWTEGYFREGLDNIWRPLVSMSFAVQAWAHPNHAWPSHAVNVALHGVASAMVGALGARLAGRRVGLIAGLLFAAHPVHVEAVAGLVGRAEAMATIAIIAALLLVIDRPLTVARAAGVTVWFLVAALCKEQGILVPIMVLAWFALARGADDRDPLQQQADRRAKLALAAMLTGTLAAYVTYRNRILPWYWERSFLDPAINPLIRSVGADRWLQPVAILGRYVGLLFAPWRLSADYSAGVFTPQVNWAEPHVYVGFICIAAGVTLLLVAWVRRWGALAFCLFCFALLCFMVANVILIGTVFGERLAYVPSAFFCVVIAMALCRLPPRGLVAVMSLLLSLATLRTVTYAWQWNDLMRFYRYTYATQPRAANANLLLAVQLTEDAAQSHDPAKLDEAAQILAHAREVAPQSWLVWYHSAKVGLLRHRPDDAVRFAQTAMKLHPSGTTAGLYGDACDAAAGPSTSTAPTSAPAPPP